MCDAKKYSEIYKEIAKLDPDDTLQLVLECENEEEKDFYEMVLLLLDVFNYQHMLIF